MSSKRAALGAGDAEGRKVISSGTERAFRNKTTSPSPASRRERAIADIRVGERHRRDLGDIDGLAASMASIGLLHPVVVTPEGLLICGERRLRAAQLLGWKTIPVTIRSEP